MAHWLVKSEPFKWSWDQQMAAPTTHWDGVRNYQAANNLRAMRIGDQAFFYHSNEGKEIVGIVEVVREAYPDPGDDTGKFVMVDFKAVRPLPRPVTLAQIKNDPALATIALIRQSRLSVCPITENEWQYICALGQI
jgi:predicted RNA-binding protein with PUA-like domain